MKSQYLYLREQLKDDLDQAPMTPRQKKVLEYRFGLIDNSPHTLEETGQIFGVTRERVRQMQADAIKIYQQWKSVKSKFNLTNT